MIKVIDTGPHKSVVKQVVCHNCGVTLEYVPADVKSETYMDYGGGTDTDHFIPCANCNKKIVLRTR